MHLIRHHFNTIDSTNNWAKQNVHLLPHDSMMVVSADAQTAGRGSFERQWLSPDKENLYVSFCFFIEHSRADIGNIPQILALSIAKVLRKLEIPSTLKWPNDVLASGKKIAGILTETTPFENKLFVVVGVGLNVNMSSESLDKLGRPATSIFVETEKKKDVEEIFCLVEKEFVSDLTLFLSSGFSPFVQSYRDLFFIPLSALFKFRTGKTDYEEGAFEGINNDGTLNVRLTNGAMKRLMTGELFL